MKNTGRDTNGTPSRVVLGDGTITKDGTFAPAPLSAEDAEKLREVMKAQSATRMVKLPDGAIRITVTVPPEIAEPLEAWADGCNEPVEDYIDNQILTALNATVLGNAVA